MGEIALTKTMEEKDLTTLRFELKLVDAHFGVGQHPARRWEYAMALRASEHLSGPIFYDVGGAGSPLRAMLSGLQIIDPKETVPLEMFSGLPAAAVFCISTIEHVPALEEFCFHLARVTEPGGLLFITSDIWDEPAHVPDNAHFRWDRVRIFCPETWKRLAENFHDLGFSLLGAADWNYHGCVLENWGYSLFSLALVKEI